MQVLVDLIAKLRRQLRQKPLARPAKAGGMQGGWAGFLTFRNKVNTQRNAPGPQAMGRFREGFPRNLRIQAGPSKYERFESLSAKSAPWSSC